MGTGHTSQGNIIIVDDTPENLRLLASMLSERGYKVRPAPSGSHALTTTQKELPDLILLDIMMPGIDGYEVCRRLQADERMRDIPVIFLSALDEVENKMKGFEAGGVDYITKPFHEKEVLMRVETHLKIRNLQQKLQTETQRFKTLADATFESIFIHTGGIIIDVNPAAAKLLRCREAALIGAELSHFFPEAMHHLLFSDQATPFEGEMLDQENNRISVEIRTKTLPSKDTQLSVTAIRDLTWQKKMEFERAQLLQENTALKLTMEDRYKFGEIIGRSAAMRKVYELVSKAAGSDFPVLLYGESGTGKELAAKTIHALSWRQSAPFITVNCGAVTESLFEREFFGHRKGAFTDAHKDEPGFFAAAHKGTLFLDELGELPLAMQVKLLRVLESGEYTPVGDVTARRADVRIVAATNTDLVNRVRDGKFREDLYYRIHVIEITLPPLRERREDIRLLVEHILAGHNAVDKMADLPEELREMLYHYDWPGNVRELMNTIQRYLATDDVTLPGNSQLNPTGDDIPVQGLHSAIEALEQKMLVKALEKSNWHRGATAKLLKIPRRSLQRKMQKYNLQPSG